MAKNGAAISEIVKDFFKDDIVNDTVTILLSDAIGWAIADQSIINNTYCVNLNAFVIDGQANYNVNGT